VLLASFLWPGLLAEHIMRVRKIRSFVLSAIAELVVTPARGFVIRQHGSKTLSAGSSESCSIRKPLSHCGCRKDNS
jgi:hypothetical protein